MSTSTTAAPSVDPESDAASPEGSARPWRSTLKLIVWALVGCAVVALASWLIAAHSVIAGVTVTSDSAPISCDGTEVGIGDPIADAHDPIDPRGFVRPIVAVASGMKCHLRFHVINHGLSEVRLSEVRLPLMGQGSAMGLVPTRVNPNGFDVVDAPDDVDAHIKFWPLVVGPGEDMTLVADIDYHGGGHYGMCGGAALPIPTVTAFAFDAYSEDIAPSAQDVIWYEMGTAKQCPDTYDTPEQSSP